MSYTPEQVERIAKAMSWVDDPRYLVSDAVQMLRAYAATLRQQAGAKASVTDEVARAVLVQYLDLSGGNTSPGDNITAMRAALEAVWPQPPSPQSTQGEAGPVVSGSCTHGVDLNAPCRECAERARVPKDLVSAARSLKRLASVVRKYGTCAPGALEDVADSILAVAAPSQPAEGE